jgi:GTPase
MGVPEIAIVGRPNVGKSSLLNRLAGQRVSIVAPEPGVTRDRVAALIEVDPPVQSPRGTPGKLAEFVDTGGFGAYIAQGKRFDDVGADLATLAPDIEAQIGVAADRAELILLVVDAQSGRCALDDEIAARLRRHGQAGKVMLVANKVDNEKWVPHSVEAAAMGFGPPLCVSATSGYGVGELLEAIYARLGERGGEAVSPPPEEMKLAIVAKRNAGKSTLINTLAGEPRVIVSEIAGTTRDAIDVRFEIEGRRLLAIDTAGIRKHKSFADHIELYAYHRMLEAIRRADVAIFMIDATVPVSQVDAKLGQELQHRFKPTVIAVNKWDLVSDRLEPEAYESYLTKELRGLEYAPIAFISAKDGQGVRDLVAMAFNLYQQASHIEPTGPLNRIVRSIIERHPPSAGTRSPPKVFYAAQIDVRPPTIALVVNEPQRFTGTYQRYLLNRLHEELPFSEVPIKLLFRRRRRDEQSAEPAHLRTPRAGARSGPAQQEQAPRPAPDR